MNEPINRKPAVASTAKGPEMRLPVGVRCVVLFAVLMFVNLTTVAFAQLSSCPGIHVKILNIRGNTGTVDCALFDSPVGFPIDALGSATKVMVMKVRNEEARCDFEEIPPGTYALTVIHDENMNGKLDTNWLGIPKEGYAFSNDAKVFLAAPSFSVASFQYDGGIIDLTISLHY